MTVFLVSLVFVLFYLGLSLPFIWWIQIITRVIFSKCELSRLFLSDDASDREKEYM